MSTVCRRETQSLFTWALGTETSFASGRVPAGGPFGHLAGGASSTTSLLDGVVASPHL